MERLGDVGIHPRLKATLTVAFQRVGRHRDNGNMRQSRV